MNRVRALPTLDAARHQRSVLHSETAIWLEKNCYVDIWIEVIHASGLEPRAVMPFVLGLDFEGDQWTFFKPPHGELWWLYGIDVQELNAWRTLLDHSLEHVRAGKLISTEADAFWLPDTAGTDYRNQHTKSTIVIEDIDLERGVLGYFHNAGYFRLEGEDFRQTFRLDAAPDPTFMPLFAEVIRLDRIVRLPAHELAARSLQLLRTHHARRPLDNPVRRFGERLREDLPMLQERGLAYYHAWAFATIRQLGAAFELAAAHLDWLAATQGSAPYRAAPCFLKIAIGAKTLILKAARAVNARRALDSAGSLDALASAWSEGMDALGTELR